MRNKVVKKLLMIAMAVTMISGTSLATVYANANPPAEETTTAVVEETTTEKSKDTEKAEDTGRVTGESNNSAFSTPGNAQLVDDTSPVCARSWRSVCCSPTRRFRPLRRTPVSM